MKKRFSYNKNYFNVYVKQNSDTWKKIKKRRQFIYRSVATKINKLVQSNKKPIIIIEVGCGMGFLTETLSRKIPQASLYASDISKYACMVVKKNVKNKNLKICIQNAENLNYPCNFADCILAFDLVEHLHRPNKFFAQAMRVLKNNGVLLLSTPNPNSIGKKIKKINGKKMVWFANRDKTHISIKKINTWRNLLKKNNFQKVKDGSDYLWDTPYFNYFFYIQKIIFNGLHRILTYFSPFISWEYGENYYGIWRKIK